MFKNSQTKLLGVVGLLSILAGAVYYAVDSSVHKSGKFAVLALIPLLINLYTVHCIINGNCTIYSWLLTIVFTLYAGSIFFMYGRLLTNKLRTSMVVKQQEAASASLQSVAEQAMGIKGF